MLYCGDEIRMTLGWICLRCGEAHPDIWFKNSKCKRCNWTRPSKLKELITNLKYPENKKDVTSDVKTS